MKKIKDGDLVLLIVDCELLQGVVTERFDTYHAYVKYTYDNKEVVKKIAIERLFLQESRTRLTEENLFELGFKVYKETFVQETGNTESITYAYKLAENKYILVMFSEFKSIFYENVALIRYSDDPRFSEDDNYITISHSEDNGFYSLEQLKMLIQSIPHDKSK